MELANLYLEQKRQIKALRLALMEKQKEVDDAYDIIKQLKRKLSGYTEEGAE